MNAFLYFRTLRESFELAFKNYLIFIPLLLGMLFSLAWIPFTSSMSIAEGFSIRKFLILFSLGILSAIVSLIIYGWHFALVKRVFQKKKLNLSESFVEGLSLAWKYFKTLLLVVILFIALVLAVALVAGFLSVFSGILAVIIIIPAVIFLFPAFLVLMYLTPIIILEEAGAWESIKLLYQFFLRHKAHTLKMGLLSLLLLFMALVPSLLLQWQTLFAAAKGQIVQTTPLFALYSQLLGIPSIIVYVVVTLLYCLAYVQVGKKIKKGAINAD